ncbi:hypothetical protein [Leptospirillum ferriphilum]|uniref:hypothetical protein n=1 Tax=Leptospirillum ferriphilum TaxID=178606 RepID=UPI000984447D|nr:hypothetical protein [Leptospirillum ferriphilum]OOH84244.1 hypothetical protein BOX30_00240 [Leptospirillum ferriphilum]
MRVSIGYRSIRLFASEQWDLLRDIFARIGELVRPRIELIRTRLKKSRISSRKGQLLELLGEEASSGIRTSGDWLEHMRKSEKVRALIKRINSLERLEKKLRHEALLLEETGVIWLLTNLTAELGSRKLEAKIHWVQDDSPFKGFSIAELRQEPPVPGLLPLLALRGPRQVELSPDTPLQENDMLVYLSSSMTPASFQRDPQWQLYSRM